TKPYQDSLTSGESGTRPRAVFSPTRPLQADGTRIEPPPSDACASGTTPAATSAEAPPDEPPEVWPVFHGLRVTPNRADSVVSRSPYSGVVEVAIAISPAARWRSVSTESKSGVNGGTRLPPWLGTPLAAMPRSLITNGTPANGAARSTVSACRRAAS